MTDTFENTGPENTPEPINEALLRDLRSLPMVTAPLDFQVHLQRKISEIEATATLPWWQRFFKPAREGGFPIPAFAYGAVATVVVLTVSIYVYRATNVEQTMREQPIEQIEQTVPQAIDQEATQQTEQTVPQAMDQEPKQQTKQTVPQAIDQDRVTTETRTTPDAEIKALPAKPSPGRTPSSNETKVKAPAKKLRVVPATPPSDASPPAEEQDEKTESYELIFKTRGGVDASRASADTTLADSLRRLDSLRQLLLQRNFPKNPDPR